MLSILISILISLGVITTDADYHNLSEEEQTHYQETIIIEDLTEM